jgi:hypothetical protein
MDRQFMARWLNSPLKSLYYSLQVMSDIQDKSNAYAAISDVDVENYLANLLEGDSAPDCNCAE